MQPQQANNQLHESNNESGGGNGLEQSNAAISASFVQQYPTHPGTANPHQLLNTSSIEQQLDLKYKAYSTTTSQATVTSSQQIPQNSASKPTVGGANQAGMLPQHSQFLYSNNLRQSMDIINPQQLDAAQSLQQQHQYLNMNASMGSQQNQNLGPTQIFYQGVPPAPSTTAASANANQAATPGAATASGLNAQMNQNQLLAQLLGQGGLPTPGQGAGGAPPLGSNNSTTNMLLLELLRQNTMQQQQQVQQHPQQQAHQILTPDQQPQNPSNQSMYGQGFLSATQLLAQQASASQQQQQQSHLLQIETPGMTKSPSLQQQQQQLQQVTPQQQPQQQQQNFDNSLLSMSTATNNAGGQNSGAGGYSQNLNSIYQNLNNYQVMIDNLESSVMMPNPPNPNRGAPTSNTSSNQQFDQLNQSRFQHNPAANQQLTQQDMMQHNLRQQQISPARQTTTSNAYERWKSSNTAVDTQSMNVGQTEKPLSSQSRLIDAFLVGGNPANPGDDNELLPEQPQTNTAPAENMRRFGDEKEENTAWNNNGRDEDNPAAIMWPSSSSSKPTNKNDQHQQKNAVIDFMMNQQEMDHHGSFSAGNDWKDNNKKSQNMAQPRNVQHAASYEDVDDEDHSNNYGGSGGMQTDFNNYREEHSSGFDQHLQQQQNRDRRGEDKEDEKVSNHWMRQSKNVGLDIDDMPIPTAAGDGPKTFEELLAEKMEAAEALSSAQKNVSQELPKKQFLKRKQPAYVPPRKAPAKQYKYYSDAIARTQGDGSNGDDDYESKKVNRDDHLSQQDQTARNQNSRRATGGGQQSDERKDRRQRHQSPRSRGAQQNSSGRRDNSDFGGEAPAPQQPSHHAMMERPQRNTSQPPQANQPPAPPIAAKPFLKRGTGTAHLQGRMQSKNVISSNSLQQQNPNINKPATPKLDKANAGQKGGLFQKQQPPTQPQTHQRNNPSQQHDHHSMMRQSIDDFQRLEQACNDGGVIPHQAQHQRQQPSSLHPQSQMPPRHHPPTSGGTNQQRKKKLFDDSDSEENDEPQDNNDPDQYNINNNQISPSGGARSNIVKKMFYNNNNKASADQQQTKQMSLEDDEAKPFNLGPGSGSNSNNNMVMNSQMEALLAKKQEQLEKAIQRYNADNDQLNQKKAQYDNMIRKLKIDQREVDAQKKRQADEVERLKEEEMGKVRKEKKALEQRQKNFQLVSNTAKKEREEIDQLRREYNKYKADSELKAKKQQSTIERLTKQNNELKQKTKELQEDLRAMEQQRIILEKGGATSAGAQGAGSALNRSTSTTNQPGRPNSTQQSRYNFSSNGNNIQQQQKNQAPGGRQNGRGGGAGGSQQQPGISAGAGEQNAADGATTTEDMMKDQMIFRDMDDDEVFENEESQFNDRRNDNKYADVDDDDEDEEDLQEEEADQVFDDFGAGLMKHHGMDNSRGAVTHTIQNTEPCQQLNMMGSNNLAAPDHDNIIQGSKTAGAALDDEEEDFSLKFPKEYHGKTIPNQKVVEQFVGHDGKIQRIYQNGKKEVIFNNGVKRESFPDGYTIVYFNNQDIKQTFADGKVVYFFAEAQTTQTTFPDKLQVFKFSNNQIEKHFPDRTKEIIFPDGTIKCIFEDGEEESIFPDGTIQKIEKSGIKAIEFANGQKDILYPDGIRVREFPDGKVRKTYPDGHTEMYQR